MECFGRNACGIGAAALANLLPSGLLAGITPDGSPDALPDVKVFQAGTKAEGKQIVTDGGRVLSVAALGNTIEEAQRKAYRAMDLIKFEGMHFRKDIGRQAVRGR